MSNERMRFVIVYYNEKNDYYTLLMTNQSRFHFDNAFEAIEFVDSLRPSLEEKLGIKPNDVIVIKAFCYAHGDCCATVFDSEYVLNNQVSMEPEINI